MVCVTPKQARIGAGLTQKDVADRMNMHVQTYQKLESNPAMMTIKQAADFATVVGLRFEDIIFFTS